MPQDMSQVPLNYRPSMQYTGRIRDLLSAPGYTGLQQDLVKMERDKLARQFQVEISPEAMDLFGLRERERLHQQALQEAKQREAERQQRLLADMQKVQAIEAQRRAKMENERMEIYQYPGGVMVGNTPEGRSAIAKRRAMDDWNKSQPSTQYRSIDASKLDYMRGSYGFGGRF